MCYAEKARGLGVNFIQLQEPYAVGGYAGKDIMLSDEQLTILDLFYKELNYNEKYKDYPLVVFHGYHQRRMGCFGGNKYFYIDSDGNIHSCPYCRSSHANVLDGTFEQCIQKPDSSCLSFSSAASPVN
jgi:MoaA/NifB/PqqE/SkfB family radical SAM enzyme